MRTLLLRSLYTLLVTLGLPIFFIRLAYRSLRNPGYRQHVLERLGIFSLRLPTCIWIHAVSLGESIAVTPLIHKLQQAYPDLPILVTHMTPTGRGQIQRTFGNSVHQLYIPYDLPWLIQIFLGKLNPKICLLMETEIWPNTLAANAQAKVPSLLINARLSARSYRRYARLPKATTEWIFNHLSLICAQTQEDASFFLKLGAPSDRVQITGNLKYDMAVPADLHELVHAIKTWNPDRPTWLAASLHKGEDADIIKAHQLLLKQHPNALLILVPRHPEQFLPMQKNCEAAFLTQTRSSLEQCRDATQVLIGDSLGELLGYYAATDIAFVGGSLIPHGGHNLLEPAMLKKPVVTGPHYFNFKAIGQELLSHKAALMVRSSEELSAALCKLIQKPELRAQLAENAYHLISAHRGSLKNTVALISRLL